MNNLSANLRLVSGPSERTTVKRLPSTPKVDFEMTERLRIYKGEICGNIVEASEAMFLVDADQLTAREYCDPHSLWRGKLPC